MPYGWGLIALSICWILCPVCVRADPSVDFPINAQVPPVARASEPYMFVFSASTFTSADGPISYMLQGQPPWLQVVSETRTFSGTPGPQDVGAATCDLVAADSSGSITVNITFVVVISGGPEAALPVLPQLAEAGPTSNPASLLLRPLQAFAFHLDPGTFVNTNINTKFYAVSANNTPLPDWVQFNSSSLTFSGTSPPLVSLAAIPQIFDIKLVASNVAGFSEAKIDFQLVVGDHILTSTDIHQAINISPGEDFSSIEFRKTLSLDNQTVADSDITSVTLNGPDWVHLDPENIYLSGTTPADASSTNVTITVLDIYGGSLNIVVDLAIVANATSLFTGTIPDANATAGDFFSYTINENLLENKNVLLSADLGRASTWLNFSPQSRVLTGTVPKGLPTGPQTIILTATEGNMSETRSLIVHVIPSLHLSSSVITKTVSPAKTSDPSARPAPSSGTSQSGEASTRISRRTTVQIVLATILPVIFIVLVICLILRQRRMHAPQHQWHPTMSQEAIARPGMTDTVTPEVAEVPPLPMTPEADPSTPSRPPRIDLPWALDSMRISKKRCSKRLRATRGASLNSAWDDFLVAESGSAMAGFPESAHTAHTTGLIPQDDLTPLREVRPISSKKRSTRQIQLQRQEDLTKRSTKRSSTMSVMSPRLPQRLSGVGHGAGGAPPPMFGEARASWQTTMGTIAGLDSRRDTVNLQDFPLPPDEKVGRDMSAILQARSPNIPPQATLRLVRNDSTRSGGLQKWYTDRARDQLEGNARFSSASSRPSSNSRLFSQNSLGGRAISTTLKSDGDSSLQFTQPFSPGPVRGRRAASVERFVGPSSYLRTPSKLRQDVSTASSGQFDSALSAGSWEDENLIEEEDQDGMKQWQRGGAGNTASPRRSLEAVAASPQSIASLTAPPRRLKLADRRNPVDVADTRTERSQRNRQGNLAFV